MNRPQEKISVHTQQETAGEKKRRRGSLAQAGKTLLHQVLLPSLVWFSIWEIASGWVGQELLLPSPFVVAETLADLVVTDSFWGSVLATLKRVSLGVCGGTMLGVLLGGVSFFSPLGRNILSPWIKTVQATPVVSFILLILLWTKRDYVPAVVAALMVLPLLWSSTKKGLEETDSNLLELGRAYGFSPLKMGRLIYAPSCVPYFLNGLSSGISLGWKSGVAAEVICTPPMAMGTAMSQSKLYLDTPSLLAWTAVVIVLSAVMERGVQGICGVLWKRKQKEISKRQQ